MTKTTPPGDKGPTTGRTRSGFTRRQFVATTAVASAAMMTSPFVRGAHAAGKLSVAFWDHWVPGANDTMSKLVNAWAEKEKVEVAIDFVTSQGNKNLLMIAAESQAKAGHDLLAMPTWWPQANADSLEPLNDVMEPLIKQNGKVNEVYSVGHGAVDGDEAARLDNAGELLAEVLSEVTGLEIEHWLAIDFAGFQEMVDAVGGVTVENPVAFDYTTIEEFHHQGRWEMGGFEAGEIHLDGDEALAYARARYTSVIAESNDFARSVRQARILGALRTKLGAGGIGSILPGLGLMDAMEQRVRTDLSAIDLFLLSSHLSSDRRVELAEDVALTATTNTIGQYILIPAGWTGPGDYGGLHAYLAGALADTGETGLTDAP